jgi:hypothetical protein
MKYVYIIATIFLLGCAPEEQDSPKKERPLNSKPQFNVLRATVNEDDISDVSIFCIDGVKYVAVPGLGMSVKYANDGDNDPYTESCVNK